MKYKWLAIFYDGRTFVETHHCHTRIGALAVILMNCRRKCRKCICRATPLPKDLT